MAWPLSVAKPSRLSSTPQAVDGRDWAGYIRSCLIRVIGISLGRHPYRRPYDAGVPGRESNRYPQQVKRMPNISPSKDNFVRTVCGDIAAQDVGFAHCHEHAFTLPGPSTEQDPDLVIDDLEKTEAELSAFHASDGRTIVDAQSIGPERAPQLQRQASERSKVNIVACTGFHRSSHYPVGHFRFTESAETLAERLIAEIADGMAIYANSEIVEKTDVRAGMIKFASDYHLIDDNTRKLAEAAAIAHQATGAPILTHCEIGTCGVEQTVLFEKLGVDPSALLISHLDRNPDVYVHEDVAESGAYLVYDGVSHVRNHPDSTVIKLIRTLLEAGHGRQILLGMNMYRRSLWRSYGGGPGITYLGDVFLAKLRRAGLTYEMIDMFTGRNPADALAFRRSSSV